MTLMYDDVLELILQYVGNNFVHRHKYKLMYRACLRELHYVTTRRHFIVFKHYPNNRSFHVMKIVFNHTLDAYNLRHTIYFHPAVED